MSLLYFIRYPLMGVFIACALLIPSTMALGGVLPDSSIIAFSTPHRRYLGWEIALLDLRTQIIHVVDDYPWRIPLAMAWSPDGSRLAYATFSQPSDVYVHDIQAGLTINVTHSLGDDRYPTWSPDSARLLFYSNQGAGNQTYDLYQIAADGTDLRRLTTGEALMPALSPDGTQVVFTATAQRDLYLMNGDGSAVRQLTEGLRSDHSAVWSPDGSQIAFVGSGYVGGQVGHVIFILDTACFKQVRCADQPEQTFPEFRIQGMPQWSPDGRYLAFVAKGRQDRVDALYLTDTQNDNVPRKIIENVYYNYVERWPMWSPDSQRIAFSRRDEPGLFVLEVATGFAQQVANLKAIYPVWRP